MPKAQKKSKRYWYTYAFFDREGTPHQAHRNQNFTHWHGQSSLLLSDLASTMKKELGHKGAYAAIVWPGQLDEWTAIHSDARPLFNVFEGGRIERV
jgi:hypothetical protein